MLELWTLSRGLCIFGCLAVATGAWCGGVWSIWRALRTLPQGSLDLPFFSEDPRLITREGRLWRRRVYLCLAYFLAGAVMGVAFLRM